MPYSKSFKKQILDLCQNGASVSAVAKECAVPRSTIYRWLKEEICVETSDQVYSSSDIRAMERKVAKLEKIIAILKTVPCTAHAPLKDRLDALEQLHSEYDVHTLCEALDVSRGTYYNHIRRNKRDNEELSVDAVREIMRVYRSNSQCINRARNASDLDEVKRYLERKSEPEDDANVSKTE